MATIEYPPRPAPTGNPQVDQYLTRLWEWAYRLWYSFNQTNVSIESDQQYPPGNDGVVFVLATDGGQMPATVFHTGDDAQDPQGIAMAEESLGVAPVGNYS